MSATRSPDDPYRFVGRQDLTAHVDVSAVERAATSVGLTTVGITTQAEALMGLGVEDRLREIQADPATTFEDYTMLRSSLMRLLDPAAMGRFRVMVFGRGWPEAATLRTLPVSTPEPRRRDRRLGRMPYCRRGPPTVTLHMVVARPHRDGERDANLHARSARRAPRSGAGGVG